MVDNVLEHQHVAVGIFLLPEQGEGDRTWWRRLRRRPGSGRGLALKPVVAAPIYLQQHPLLWIAFPSAVAFGGSAATGTSQSSGQQDPPHGRAGEMDILSLCQHLAQMGMVESCIGAPRPTPSPSVVSSGTWWLPASSLCSREPQQQVRPFCTLPVVATHGARSLPSAQTPQPPSPCPPSLRLTPVSLIAPWLSTSVLS